MSQASPITLALKRLAAPFLRAAGRPSPDKQTPSAVPPALQTADELRASLGEANATIGYLKDRVKFLSFYRYVAQQMIPIHGLAADDNYQVNCGQQVAVFLEQPDLLREGLKRASVPGFVAEFGVEWGDSLRVIAETWGGPVHGFDSFQGLPADWDVYKAGDLTTKGKLPEGIANATYHVGWFADTIGPFLASTAENARFIHVDGDLYESAVDVLYGLADRIVPGTVIVFDNYIWKQWMEMEHRAFMEFALDYGVRYYYFGVSYRALSVGVVILAKNAERRPRPKGWFPTLHVRDPEPPRDNGPNPMAASHDWTDPSKFR